MELKENIDGPIGGESWRFAPRTMPWDRPARFSETNAALKFMFKRLQTPKLTKQYLNLLEAGMPIDMVVQGILMQGFMNGTFQAPVLMNMVGPLTVILWRMAESAGIRPITLADKQQAGADFDPLDMLAAEARIQNNTADKAIGANEKSQNELLDPNLMDRAGFMKFRPKPKLGN